MPRLLPRLPYLPGNRLKRFVRLLFALHSYFNEIAKCVGRFPLKDVLFGIRHGFAADRVLLYGRAAILSGEYLSDLQRQCSRFINPKPARELLEDKLLFERVFGGLARVPTNYLYSDNGRLVVVSREWNLLARCRNPHKHYRLVMKGSRGGGGKKIQFVELHGGKVLLSDREMSLNDFYSYFTRCDESLLCQFIEQSDFCRTIYSQTTNTLRLICMREPNGEPFIARAILRVGTNRSNGVDNFGEGGLAANVNLQSGMLDDAIEHDMTSPRRPSTYARHPDTGIKITGESLPDWEAARDLALLLMGHMPFLNYVGWDIVLTNSGPVLLEGNNYSGVRIAQIQSGLLSDARVRAFYQRFRVLPEDQLNGHPAGRQATTSI
jgi:Sugar-transfer associated ATP-grasp